MRVNLVEQRGPVFGVLTEGQIEAIYGAALEVLERTGGRVYHEGALELFRGGGAVVTDGNLVRIPASMVEGALRDFPRKISLAGRDGRRTVHLERNEVNFGTGSDCPFIYDRETGERRRYRYSDVSDAARLVDYLGGFDFFMSHGLVSDVPNPRTYDRHQFLAMVSNTVKPLILTAVDGEGLRDLHEMGCMIRGGEEEFRVNPLFIIYIEPSSPLTHTREAVEKLLYASDKGIPVMYTPCPSSGATAPATVAGLLVQDLAETLLGLVLSHLRRPGMPLVMGGVQTIMDMKTSTFSYGAPELALASAASTDISKWLGLPMFSTGGCSDSKVLDEQAAIEATVSLYTAMLSGATLIHDVGYLESGLNGSLEMLVLCDEIIEMVKHIGRGVRVDEEHLALDVIDRVGPGGQYLSDDHTLEHYRRDFWFPRLLDRSRVKEKMDQILETHQPEPMDEKLMEEMKKIAEKADKKAS
ncbi:MAG: trimethylamine methyltransferase family protein [Deltaproteobacteria bacterium]|nr:trimethylamine methyltransferase family protein [Deltaproteobacteria bacterium]